MKRTRDKATQLPQPPEPTPPGPASDQAPPPGAFDLDAARRAANLWGVWIGSRPQGSGCRQRFPYSITD